MKEKQVAELLKSHIDVYLNNIAIELEDSHDRWFDEFGFPIFGETSRQYHEQVYFQSYLESYTRKLINSILKDFIDEEIGDDITWPEFEFLGIYNGYTNSECEKDFGFEFINRETKIGYRYTNFIKYETVDELLTRGNVEGIVLVIWEGKDEIVGFEFEDERVRVVLLWDLFHELFWDLEEEEISVMYDLFTKEVSKAVEQANAMISLTTLPGFTPSYLYKKRGDVVGGLRKEVEGLTRFFVNNDDFKHNETNSIQLIDTYKLPEYFLNKRYENAFVGTADYAKSYMTSEYLFRYFENNPMFDYTPIVSGYLKSIEQLLHAILSNYYKINNIENDLSDYTLGKYITDIQRERVFRREAASAKRIIVGCLNSYRAESRNNLFHKDYFNSWEKVEQIRTNTIFLYVALLGAVDEAIVNSDPAFLGILSIEYDQMFGTLDKYNNDLFSFVLDGKEYSEMRKEPRSKGLIFNENGLITNSITFKRFDYDHYEVVEFSRNNMPTEVWLADVFDKRKKKLWPRN